MDICRLQEVAHTKKIPGSDIYHTDPKIDVGNTTVSYHHVALVAHSYWSTPVHNTGEHHTVRVRHLYVTFVYAYSSNTIMYVIRASTDLSFS